MNNFSFSIPTVIHFGKGQLSRLSEYVGTYKNILLIYGGGSIKKSGLYDDVLSLLWKASVNVFELSGVEPNPRIQSVRQGVRLCREHAVDAILAVGGGSVIDCAKVISVSVFYEGDPWDVVLNESLISEAIPIFSVLTLAATGSEIDAAAVISNMDKQEKRCVSSPFMKPHVSILDPAYTFSVSRSQTSAGVVDIMSHALENYFTPIKGAYLQARMCEAVLKTIIRFGPIALESPDNYEARANLMWASSLAISSLLDSGADVKWCVHPIEHELSAYYDITHGVGLAIMTPVFLDFTLRPETAWKYVEYGENVFNIRGHDAMAVGRAAIKKTRDFFNLMGMPSSLHEIGIDNRYFDSMAQKVYRECIGSFVPLSVEDIRSLYQAAL